MLKFKRKVVLMKVEATYGVDSVPVAATDALLVRNLKVNALNIGKERRVTVKTFYANEGDIVTGQWSTIDFEIELAGAGTAVDTVAKYGVALAACGIAQTVNATVSVQYDPISTLESAVTIYFQIDGRQHKMLGCRGSKFGFRIAAGAIPVYMFSFIGLHVQPTDAALTPGTLTGFQKPLAVNNANTTPFTLHGYAGVFRELTFDAGLETNYRNLPGSESVAITGRNPTGSITLESKLVATRDWWTSVKAGTNGVLTFTHGTAVANRVKFDGTNTQLVDLDDSGEEQGVSMTKLGLNFIPGATGNDEFRITTT